MTLMGTRCRKHWSSLEGTAAIIPLLFMVPGRFICWQNAQRRPNWRGCTLMVFEGAILSLIFALNHHLVPPSHNESDNICHCDSLCHLGSIKIGLAKGSEDLLDFYTLTSSTTLKPLVFLHLPIQYQASNQEPAARTNNSLGESISTNQHIILSLHSPEPGASPGCSSHT